MLLNWRLAWRALLRDPQLTTVAVLSLAVGLAANTTIFSLVHALEFPRLIYPRASQLVFLESDHIERGLAGMLVSVPDAQDLARATRTLSHVAWAGDQSSVLDTGSQRRRVSGRRVSETFFSTFETSAAIGRTLRPEDPPGTVVLSHQLWSAAFGGTTTLTDLTPRLDGTVVSVVGVMPEAFDADAEFWIPLAAEPTTFARDDRQFSVFARVVPEATLAQATNEVNTLSATLAAAHAQSNAGWVMRLYPLSRLHGRDSRETFYLLQAAVLGMLLIACANIANLLLARGAERRHEMALRLSLGATRAHLARQLLAEGLVLALAGGLLGIVLSLWGIRGARALGGFPDVIAPTLNVGVLAFSAALSVLTGALCAAWPAWQASATAPEEALRQGGTRTTGGTGHGRSVLLAIQISAALVLIGLGALLLQSWRHRQALDLGLDPAGVVRASVSGASTDSTLSFTEALAAHPEVEAAAVSAWALPSGAGAQRAIQSTTSAAALDPASGRTFESVSVNFFKTLRVPVRAGRVFDDTDRPGAPLVAVINETLARRISPDATPVGATLRLGEATADPIVTVIGVVGDVRRSVMHDSPLPRVYLPFAQHPSGSGLQLFVRARAEETPVSRLLLDTAQTVDRSLLVEDIEAASTDLARFTAGLRMTTTVLSLFGGVGLALAALGVYGTTSYVTSTRTRELAVRAALGADRGRLLRLVLRTVSQPLAVGLVAGIALSAFAVRSVEASLFGVSATDVTTMAAAVGVLILVTLLAAARPALRAANTDPMTALRQP